MKRRNFLVQSVATGIAVTTGDLGLFAQTAVSPAPSPAVAAGSEPARSPALEASLVRAFVGASHTNLPKVKELLASRPELINASWDWGAGDWETALGAASHVGNRTIALHLIDAGARPDAFCAAMLGETDFIASLLRFSPAAANARGPHGYTLMYHVGHCGQVAMAEKLSAALTSRGADCNQALTSAAPKGHLELVAWLLKNGVDNVNFRAVNGKTALDLATEKGHDALTKLLRENGGVSGRENR